MERKKKKRGNNNMELFQISVGVRKALWFSEMKLVDWINRLKKPLFVEHSTSNIMQTVSDVQPICTVQEDNRPLPTWVGRQFNETSCILVRDPATRTVNPQPPSARYQTNYACDTE